MKSHYLTLVLLTPALGFGQADKTDDTFGSLTPKNYKPVFQTRTARKVGDILTIIISETSAAQYQTNTQNQKKEANTVGPNKVPLMAQRGPAVSAHKRWSNLCRCSTDYNRTIEPARSTHR